MMDRYQYIAVSSEGGRVTGELRSSSQREAVGKLLELGYHPIMVVTGREQRLGARSMAAGFRPGPHHRLGRLYKAAGGPAEGWLADDVGPPDAAAPM
jgi:hypothetical protein